MLLHAVDNLGGAMDVALGAADDEVVLAGGDVHTEGTTQEPQVAIGRAKKIELLAARIQLYSQFQIAPR
jgi:hypothetical protein